MLSRIAQEEVRDWRHGLAHGGLSLARIFARSCFARVAFREISRRFFVESATARAIPPNRPKACA